MQFLKNSSQTRNNLVIIRAGKNSLHYDFFFQNCARNWDRMIFSYDPDNLQNIDYSIEYIISGGLTKWTDLANLIELDFFEIKKYDRILILDDDLIPIGGADSISKLFDYANNFNLEICQPALTHDSFASWKICYNAPSFHVRFTNFVECMCPMFTMNALKKLEDDIKESKSGCGLDLIFSEKYEENENKIGIIDDILFKHTKPIDPTGGAFYLHLRQNGIHPENETSYFLNKYGISRKDVKVISGIALVQSISAEISQVIVP